MNLRSVWLIVLLSGCGPTVADDGSTGAALSPSTPKPLVDANMQLILTPSSAGHSPFIDAIDGATKSVHMVMFHLTDLAVVNALERANARAGVDVQVIVDGASVKSGGYKTIFDQMTDAGVNVIASSPGFSITHEKAMVIDGETAFITAMNMTNTYTTTRDFGVITHDADVIAEWETVFAADVMNAADGGKTTPTLHDTALIWSPVDSSDRLTALIKSAETTLIGSTESINSPAILSALEAAVKAGVDVRLIAPACDDNANPLLDYPAMRTLQKAGVAAHVMPYPASAAQPYMHSKMFVVDGKTAYVGSINLTKDSTTAAREVGIVFANDDAIGTISETFESDWAVSVETPASDPTGCPVVQ